MTLRCLGTVLRISEHTRQFVHFDLGPVCDIHSSWFAKTSTHPVAPFGCCCAGRQNIGSIRSPDHVRVTNIVCQQVQRGHLLHQATMGRGTKKQKRKKLLLLHSLPQLLWKSTTTCLLGSLCLLNVNTSGQYARRRRRN